jgi:hypothetical protein
MGKEAKKTQVRIARSENRFQIRTLAGQVISTTPLQRKSDGALEKESMGVLIPSKDIGYATRRTLAG